MADVKEVPAANSEAKQGEKPVFDPKLVKTVLLLSVLPNPGKDGSYRLQVQERRMYGKIAISSRTGFRELEDEAAGHDAIALIEAGVFKVSFGAQQGQAFKVDLVPVGQAASTAKTVASEGE